MQEHLPPRNLHVSRARLLHVKLVLSHEWNKVVIKLDHIHISISRNVCVHIYMIKTLASLLAVSCVGLSL